MSYQNKSKKRILSFILLIALIFLVLGKTKLDYPFKKHFINYLNPCISYTSYFVQEAKNVFWSFLHFFELKKENELLKKNISKLENTILEVQEIRKENQRLNELLQFKSQLHFESIPARIIGQDSSNWYNGIIINKGIKDGIMPNQAVISTKGVVGRVVETFEDCSKIMLLTDLNSQVGGLVLRTRDIGVLQGQNDDYCNFNYLSRTSDVTKGDLVITSGFDGFFPKGIILGEVFQVHFSEDFGLYKKAKILPSVDFSKLEEVLVIKPPAKEK